MSITDIFDIKYTNDISEIRSHAKYNISEASHWSINQKFYEEQLFKSNVAIFVTYIPINFHKRQMSAFVLGDYDLENGILNVNLLCSKRFYLDNSISPVFGIYLIKTLFDILKPKTIYATDVHDSMVSYYEKYGFVVYETIRDSHKMLLVGSHDHNHKNQIQNSNLDGYFQTIDSYINDKQQRFLSVLEIDKSGLECA